MVMNDIETFLRIKKKKGKKMVTNNIKTFLNIKKKEKLSIEKIL